MRQRTGKGTSGLSDAVFFAKNHFTTYNFNLIFLMKSNLFYPFFVVVLVTMTNCNTMKKTATTPVAPTPIASETTPPLPAKSLEKTTTDFTLPPYNASEKRLHDLIHAKIEVSFDWAKQYVIGKATLTMKSFFYPTDVVVLDAKNFDIKSVRLLNPKTTLKFDYNGTELTVNLPKKMTRTEEFTLLIDYVAKPNDREESSGSEAITSDKGLFFINPTGEEGTEKPRQIWTQGETQSNSRWMPTIDKPNERCTQEMFITVEDKYKTLSNGVMASSKKNADGTRTDYWKMEAPHAPYLFMMAIGEFAVVKDKWNGMDVNYYVEPAYEADARAIFPYTPEMLTFFSDRLGVK